MNSENANNKKGVLNTFFSLSPYSKFLILFIIAFIPRLIYILQVRTNPFFSNLVLDPKHYDLLTSNILKGDILQGTDVFDFSPFYPYFLSLIYKIFGHDLFISRFIQHLLGAINCILIYKISSKVFNRNISLIAFFISAFYGIFIFYEGILETESLALLVNSLFILYLLDMKFLKAGFLLGLSTIIRPNALILLPFIMLWIGAKYKFNFKKKDIYKASLTFLISTFILILPVTLRNFHVSNDLVLVSSSGGMNFYIGNNKNAVGILKEPDFIRPNPLFEHKDARKKAEELSGRKLKASEASKFWFNEGLNFIKNNPYDFLNLSLKKIYYSINFYEIPDNINYYFFKRFAPILKLPLFSSSLIIPLGFLGILLCIIKKEPVSLFYIVTGGYFLFLTLFFVSSRYRLPVIPLLIIFSAYALFAIYNFIKVRDEKSLTASFIFLVLISIPVNLKNDKLTNNFISQSHLMLSNIYYENGKITDAKKEAIEAVKMNPDNYQGLNNLAWVWASDGINLQKSLNYATRAVNGDPKNSDFYDTLGWVYLKSGDRKKALEVLSKGLLLNQENKNIAKHIRIIEKK